MKRRTARCTRLRPRGGGLRRAARRPRPSGPSRASRPDVFGHRHRLLRRERERPARRERGRAHPRGRGGDRDGHGNERAGPDRRSSPASARGRRPWPCARRACRRTSSRRRPSRSRCPARPRCGSPWTLPIGSNKPNVYLGLGDSITVGDGSSDGQGYGLEAAEPPRAPLRPRRGPRDRPPGRLQRRDGGGRPARRLRWFDPAYTLILLGTNDWKDQTCQHAGSLRVLHDRRPALDRRGREGLGQPARPGHDHPGEPGDGARGPQRVARRR